MGILLDGDQIYVKDSRIGEDEQKILDALHGRGELGKKLRADLEKNKNRAKYKIEIHFGKNRSMEAHKTTPAGVTIWESGRRFHGGGDQKMYFCGYSPPEFAEDQVCGKPILDKFFGVNHVVCPSCKRECFLDGQVKKQHVDYARSEGHHFSSIQKLQRLPVVADLKLVRMTPMNMAKFLARLWHQLDCNADLYFKYHPTDIRCRDVPEVKKPGVYEKARVDRVEIKENRGLLIYPLEHIIRDTIATGSVVKKFLDAIRA